MQEFGSYFEGTWIGSSTSATTPIFNMFLWNQYDSVLASLSRSNNLVEGSRVDGDVLSSPVDFFDCPKEGREPDLLTESHVEDWLGSRALLRRKWMLYD